MSKLAPGRYPVWTDDGRIAYYGVAGQQGLFIISAENVARQTGGADPKPQLVLSIAEARPSDASGSRLYFSTSSRDGNWEAYAVNLDGNGLTNLSNSPDSSDGLPAASPDGRWVAFVSDREDKKWAIWIVPSSGGEPKKLVDLPTNVPNPSPWGSGDHDWTNERITWGP
jgi:Tol biopolymer transport system component